MTEENHSRNQERLESLNPFKITKDTLIDSYKSLDTKTKRMVNVAMVSVAVFIAATIPKIIYQKLNPLQVTPKMNSSEILYQKIVFAQNRIARDISWVNSLDNQTLEGMLGSQYLGFLESSQDSISKYKTMAENQLTDLRDSTENQSQSNYRWLDYIIGGSAVASYISIMASLISLKKKTKEK